MSAAEELLVAVVAAEELALAQHEAGTCHLSEWSCSYCEAQRVSVQSERMGA